MASENICYTGSEIGICYSANRYIPSITFPGTPGDETGLNETYIKSDEKVSVSDIINQFIQDVTDRVIRGALHTGYTIRSPYTGTEVVPANILGSISKIPKPSVGVPGSIVTANTIYNSLISVTRYLLRVGTYSYYESKSVTGSWPNGSPSSNSWSSSGKALFSDSYASSQIGSLSTASLSPTVSQSPTLSTRIIGASGLKDLISRCYSSWNSSTRPHYSQNNIYCHSSCHNVCHSSCHQDCDNCNNSCDSSGGWQNAPCHNACYQNGDTFSPCHIGYCFNQSCNA